MSIFKITLQDEPIFRIFDLGYTNSSFDPESLSVFDKITGSLPLTQGVECFGLFFFNF